MSNYLNSSKIKVFPSAFRDSQYDPESFLMTEGNLGKTSTSGYSFKSFIKELPNDKLEIVLGGYRFYDIDKSDIIEAVGSPSSGHIYAAINTAKNSLSSPNDEQEIDVLVPYGTSTAAVLDVSSEFKGIYFALEGDSALDTATYKIEVLLSTESEESGEEIIWQVPTNSKLIISASSIYNDGDIEEENCSIKDSFKSDKLSTSSLKVGEQNYAEIKDVEGTSKITYHKNSTDYTLDFPEENGTLETKEYVANNYVNTTGQQLTIHGIKGFTGFIYAYAGASISGALSTHSLNVSGSADFVSTAYFRYNANFLYNANFEYTMLPGFDFGSQSDPTAGIDVGSSSKRFRDAYIARFLTNGTTYIKIADIASKSYVTTAINALDLTTVGQNGYYIDSVAQNNGQVSATKKAFDTTLTSATDNNAPTTKAVKDAIDGVSTSLNTHTSNKNNPHAVTATQLGLGSVVNTGDSDTPVSGGTTKFTTGGAYTLKQSIDAVDTQVDNILNGTTVVPKATNAEAADTLSGFSNIYSSSPSGNYYPCPDLLNMSNNDIIMVSVSFIGASAGIPDPDSNRLITANFPLLIFRKNNYNICLNSLYTQAGSWYFSFRYEYDYHDPNNDKVSIKAKKGSSGDWKPLNETNFPDMPFEPKLTYVKIGHFGNF